MRPDLAVLCRVIAASTFVHVPRFARGVRLIYEVRAQSGERVHSFGARLSLAEAELVLGEARDRVAAAGGRNDRYWIEEIDATGLFEVPSRPTPRERFSVRVPEKPGAWNHVHVDVLRAGTVVAAYDRDYPMLQTFEPFRQGDRDFALISADYTATSVIDLASGEVVAGEEPAGSGFTRWDSTSRTGGTSTTAAGCLAS